MLYFKMGVTMSLVASLLIEAAKAACACSGSNTAYIDCFASKLEATSVCGTATSAIATQTFVFGCTQPQIIQNPAAGGTFFATTKDSVSGGCNDPEIIQCYTPSMSVLTVTPSWVYFDSALTATTKTAVNSASAAFALWAKVPAGTNSAQTVSVTSKFGSTAANTQSYTLGQCNPGPLQWTPSAGFTIPAQTYYFNLGLILTITTSAATRTTCTTCPPTYAYAVLQAGTFAAVSSSVFTSVTNTLITIQTSTSQTATSYVFRATDTSVSPPLVLDAPFTVTWKHNCQDTIFDSSTFTVTTMTTYVNSPTSSVVTQPKTFKDSISNTFGNLDGYTFCGPRTYIFTGSQASLLSYNTATMKIELAGPTLISSYSATPQTINLDVCLTNFPTVCKSTTFTVTIGCKIASAAFSAFTNKSYATGAVLQTIALPTVTLTPACPYTETWSLELDSVPYSNNEFLSIASGTSIQIGKTTTSLNYMTPNPHTVKLKASYATDPNLFSAFDTFQLTLTDSCLTTSLTRTTALTDMTTSVLASVTQDASMQDTVSKTLGNLDGATLCGLRTYSMVIKDSTNTVVSAPAFVSIDASTGLIIVNPTSPPITDVGSYTAEITTKLFSYPSITDTVTINVVVDPCKVTSITKTTTLGNVIFVNLVDTSLGPYAYPTYTQVPACNYAATFSIQVNAVTQASPYLFLTYTQASYTVATNDVALQGTSHAMTLVYSFTSYSYATIAIDSTVTWTVKIEGPCVNSVLDAISDFATMTSSVIGATFTQAFTNVKDSISKTFDATDTSYEVTSNGPVVTTGPLKGTTFCGSRSYAITGAASCAALTLTYNAVPYYPVLNLAPTLQSQVTLGTLCTVTATLQDQPTVAAVTKTVNLVIQECALSSFTQNTANLPTQTYAMLGTVLSVPFPTYTQVPSCGYTLTYTCQVIVAGVASDYATNANLFSMSTCDTTSNFFTVNIEKGGTLTSLSGQIAKAGNYQIQITATLNNALATKNAIFTFDLAVIQPCDLPNFIDSTTFVMQTMTTSVKKTGQPVIQTFGAFKDNGSKIAGNMDGLTLCGLRTYAVTQIAAGSTSAFATWLSQPTAATNSGSSVEVNSQSDLDIGYSPCNTMRLTVTLQDYPSVQLNQDFQVCILPCEITNFQENSSITDKTMKIFFDPAATIAFPSYTQTPACGYPISFSGTITKGTTFNLPDTLNAPFVTNFDQSQYNIYSNVIAQAGVYSMVLKATIVQPLNYYTGAIYANSDVTWTLTLVDPCIGTVVNGNNVVVADMEYSVKNVITTQQIFPEYLSKVEVDSAALNFPLSCGSKTYTLGNEYPGSGAGSWMTFNGATRTIEVATQLDSLIKHTPNGYAVTITACLDNYPPPTTSCAGPQTFYVKIVPCRITSFAIKSPTQPNFVYNIFFPRNVQFLRPYVQKPQCNYEQTYSATVARGLGTAAAYTTFMWLSLTPTTKTPPFGMEPSWQVYSQTATEEGVYTVVQTVTLNDVYYTPQTTLSVSFTITLVDPCKTPPTTITSQNGVGQTFYSLSTVPLITTSVKFGTSVVFPFTFHDDLISSNLRSINPTLDFVCGPRQYTLTFDPPKTVGTQFQSVDSVGTGAPPKPSISVLTNNDLDFGVHRMKLTVELQNYGGIVLPIEQYFNINIESCIVKEITYLPLSGYIPAGNSAQQPIIINMFEPVSQYLPGAIFTQKPDCGYPLQYTQQLVALTGGPPEQKKWDPASAQFVTSDTVAPSFSKLSTSVAPYQFQWNSQIAEDDKCVYGLADATGVVDKRLYELANINPYHMQLVAKLQNNPVPPNYNVNPKSLVLQNDDIKFYIWPKDPCFNDMLISPVPLTMLTFVNSTLIETQKIATTKDQVSIDVGSSLQDDYCGQRTYTVTQLSGALVKFFTVQQGPPPVIKLATQDPYQAGIKQLLYKTHLTKYPWITTSVPFEVMIFYLEPCVNFGEKWYQVGTDELALTFSPYQVIPTNSSFTVEYQLRVTTMKPNSTQITYRSNLLDLPKWINFDPLQRQIKIFTSDALYFGNYTIQIVGKVTQYDFVESISEFLLHIVLQPPPPQPNNPPFFVETLKNADFIAGDSWSFTLPRKDDKEQDKITQKILQKPDWLKFDSDFNRFYVDEGATGSKTVGTYTVIIQLTDTTTAKQEFTFLLEVKPVLIVVKPYVDPDINRPKPEIDSINPKGLVTILWSKSMRTPRNLTYIQEGNTTYNDLLDGVAEVKVPVMDVRVLESKCMRRVLRGGGGGGGARRSKTNTDLSQEEKNLNFTWEIKSFQQKTLVFQLWFDDPYQVSYENCPEELEIIFYEEEQFLGKEFGLSCRIGPEYNITKSIPPQVPPKTIKRVRTANNKMSDTLATVGNVITQLMLSGTLNQLWSLINTQQLIVMIPLFKIILPNNAAEFFAYVMQIAAFDVVPTDDIFGYIFQQPVEQLPDALNSNFDAVGFSTIYFFNNMGSLIFGLMSAPLLAIVAKILFIFKQYPKFIRRAKKIERSIYWGSTIRILLESYTVMVVCCAIQSTDYSFDSSRAWGPILYSAVSVFYFLVCLALPVFQAVFCYKNFDKLDDEKFEQKWGVLWEGMRINDKGFIAYNFTFLIRRLWLALSVVYSRNILFYQVAGLMFQIIISMIVTGQTRPFEDKRANDLEYFNEIMIMLVLYNFMCFTDWQPNEKIQYFQGYVACGVTLAHIVLNLILMAQENIRVAALRYKKYKLWREYAKVRSEAMHQQQKDNRQKLFFKSRRFKIVDEAKNIVKMRKVNENLSSIEEIENSWCSSEVGSQHVSYSYVVVEEKNGSFSFSSVEIEQKGVNKSGIEQENLRTDQLLRQPAEAPKIPPQEQDPFTQANREHKAIHKLLGEKKLLDWNLGLEKDVHARLGQKVTPDSLVADPQAIMDELWGISDFTQLDLKKQPKKDKADLSDKTLLSKLARRAEQDVGTFITESEIPRIYRGQLKLTADKNKIHAALFKKFESGDGPKDRQATFGDNETNGLQQAKTLKNEQQQSLQSARFNKLLTDILDKPEKPEPKKDLFAEIEFDFEQPKQPERPRDIFGEMEFDFGEEPRAFRGNSEEMEFDFGN